MLKLHKDILLYIRINIIKQTLFIKNECHVVTGGWQDSLQISLVIVIIAPQEKNQLEEGRIDDC